MKRYVAVAGTIGAGKTSLVAWLAKRYGLRPFYEPNEQNPYLADFYRDMARWAFHSQSFFLAHKLELHQDLERSKTPAVIDRTIYEDAEIFAKNLYAQRLMHKRDWEVYQRLYAGIRRALRPPDVLIALRCSLATTKKLRHRESGGGRWRAPSRTRTCRRLHRLYARMVLDGYESVAHRGHRHGQARLRRGSRRPHRSHAPPRRSPRQQVTAAPFEESEPGAAWKGRSCSSRGRRATARRTSGSTLSKGRRDSMPSRPSSAGRGSGDSRRGSAGSSVRPARLQRSLRRKPYCSILGVHRLAGRGRDVGGVTMGAAAIGIAEQDLAECVGTGRVLLTLL